MTVARPASSRSATSSVRWLNSAIRARPERVTSPTTTLVWCDAEAKVAEVAARMMDCYVRHALVEDGGRLVGVVSARDLLGVYASADMRSE
jgi:CBS domain-containing protein